MIVQLIGSGKSVTTDLHLQPVWAATAAANHGSVRLHIPRNAAVWGDEILDEGGGFLIVAQTPYGRGVWIADIPVPTADGLAYPGLSLSQYLEKNHVSSGPEFTGALAGHVIKAAYRDGIAGRVPLRLGSVLMAPPLVNIRFTGQPIIDVITQLRDDTGHEWWVDESFTLHWGAFQGRYREGWVCDDGALFRSLQQGTLLDTQAEVIEVGPDGATFTARSGRVPALWQTQRVVRL